ncbi:hypothetical protein V1478_001597 [Vespula squamosa]|uniref:Secreted protein n=1 Tax=Vespula squamosa TaxID=30214 RepID=A0ABD2C1X8_VESSQ
MQYRFEWFKLTVCCWSAVAGDESMIDGNGITDWPIFHNFRHGNRCGVVSSLLPRQARIVRSVRKQEEDVSRLNNKKQT